MATNTQTIRFDTDDVHTRRDAIEIDGVLFYPETLAAAEALVLAASTIAEQMKRRYRLPDRDGPAVPIPEGVTCPS